MPDLFLEPDGDLLLDDSGDLILATGWDEVRQRILRDLVTCAQKRGIDGRWRTADYIFEPDFGLGLGDEVDAVITEERYEILSSLMKQAIMADVEFSDEIEPTIIITDHDDNSLQIDASFRTKDGVDQNITFALVPG